MNKLKTIIQYECVTSLKYISIFYAIQYSIVLITYLIVATNVFGALEFNSVVYVSIFAILGFKEDFKMLIQHGFTRKYIFLGSLSMFAFVSAILAAVDTVMGSLLHEFMQGYPSLYGDIYGYENMFVNFIWLLMLYMAACSLANVIILIINKIGKTRSIYVSIVVIGMVMLLVRLYTNFISNDMKDGISEFLLRIFGLSPEGAINHLAPLVTMLLMISCISLVSYIVIRRTELE